MPSVLIVDDLTSIHEMLEAVIQPIGFTAAFATDGTKALERYKAERFDVVLVDVQMKPMDGIALLRELKRVAGNVFADFQITSLPDGTEVASSPMVSEG